MSAQASCDAARAHDLYRRARMIHELAVIARDCTGIGAMRNLARAEMSLRKIETLAGGREIGE
jgi:hypothetical protein